MAVAIASDSKPEYQATVREHARLVALELRSRDRAEQVALVCRWLEKARAMRRAIQEAASIISNRRRPRGLTFEDREELIELTARRAVGDGGEEHVQRGIEAARAYWPTCPPQLLPEVKLGSLAWIAASEALASFVGREAWPLTNPEHLVISAGMHAMSSKTFLPQHVAVLALAELGHARMAIGRALTINDADVRKLLRAYQANP